jgi:hypothetical protein
MAVWLALLVLAVLNGGVRDLWLSPWLGDTVGRALSTVVLCGLILLVQAVVRKGARVSPSAWYSRLTTPALLALSLASAAAAQAQERAVAGCPATSELRRSLASLVILRCETTAGSLVDSTDVRWNQMTHAYAAIYNQTLLRPGH